MKHIFLLSMALIVFASSAFAEERKLDGAEITATLTDKILTAKTDTTQIFQKSGVTFYSENGSQSQGFWKIESDKYCSQWPPNQAWSCYDVLQDGTKITFVSGSGQRYEMQLPKQD
jgi:hypothetical protein